MSIVLPPPPAPGFRVLVAEPLPLLGALLADQVRVQPGVILVGSVTCEGDLLPATARLTPHLIVLDWALGGLATLGALRALLPPPGVLVIAATLEPDLPGLVRRQGGLDCLARGQSTALLPLRLAEARTRYDAISAYPSRIPAGIRKEPAMSVIHRLTHLWAPPLDPLGFGPSDSPTADEWLAAFTAQFIRHPTQVFGTQALMSGVRFFSRPFIAELAALGPVETRVPAISGYIPQAIYRAAGPIICAVYTQQISRNADPAQIEAAFGAAVPTLLDRYSRTWATDHHPR